MLSLHLGSSNLLSQKSCLCLASYAWLAIPGYAWLVSLGNDNGPAVLRSLGAALVEEILVLGFGKVIEDGA